MSEILEKAKDQTVGLLGKLFYAGVIGLIGLSWNLYTTNVKQAQQIRVLEGKMRILFTDEEMTKHIPSTGVDELKRDYSKLESKLRVLFTDEEMTKHISSGGINELRHEFEMYKKDIIIREKEKEINEFKSKK